MTDKEREVWMRTYAAHIQTLHYPEPEKAMIAAFLAVAYLREVCAKSTRGMPDGPAQIIVMARQAMGYDEPEEK